MEAKVALPSCCSWAMIARSVSFRSLATGFGNLTPHAASVRRMAVLTESELAQALADLDGWGVSDGALRKRFEFEDFAQALAYANRVGEAAERENHHPDLLVTWGAVEVSWVNH